MTFVADNPLEILKRKAITFILIVMVLGSMVAIALHILESKVHPISLAIPSLTVVVCLSLLAYLMRYPQSMTRVIQITLGWSSFIILFPEYFFLIEAVLKPERRLIDSLPPISSGLFLLTTSIIIFLHPRTLIRIAVPLWIAIAAPVVIYLLAHPQELSTPRGIDLVTTFVPAMGINLSLILFYSRLQNTMNQLYAERFHLKESSEKDALTGIFNRGTGERKLQDLINQSHQKIGIILFDIDHFKQINDTYGHLIGDRALQIISRCCEAQLRQQDILIRWGGEEFLIIVAGDNEFELAQLAERLRTCIAHQCIAEVGKVTASFGVALHQPQEDPIYLFARADKALYRAKKLGRNQVILAAHHTISDQTESS